MKKKIFKSLFAIACLLSSTSVSAYDFEVDGLYYDVVSLENLTVEVTRSSNLYTFETVDIPETVTFMGRIFSVVGIKDNAFRNSRNLTSITIPKWVTYIGESAFYYCEKLASVTILGDVSGIAKSTFSGCKSLTSFIFPESIEYISEWAFSNSGLTSITIPENVRVGQGAFSSCTNLDSITIHSNINNSDVFKGCENVKYIHITNSVNKIADRVFDGGSFKSTLKEVIIDDCDQEIYLGISGSYELSYQTYYYGCFYSNVLEKIYLGRNMSYPNNHVVFEKDADDIYIGDYVTSISGLSPRVPKVKTMTIGKGLSEIPNMSGWSSLTSLTLTSEVPQTAMGFSNSQYINLKVYVPKGTLAAYQSADVWKNFWNLQEVETTGISHISKNGETTKEVKRYDTLGREINSTQKGLNIIKMSDGTTKKVMVK